jgi:hypothetical protein
LPLPALAIAAYAAALSTRAVRFDVRAWSVTTTLAPAALHSSLSLHRTCKQCQPFLTHDPNRANHGNRGTAAGHAMLQLLRNSSGLNGGRKGKKLATYLEAGAAADAAPVQLGAGCG